MSAEIIDRADFRPLPPRDRLASVLDAPSEAAEPKSSAPLKRVDEGTLLVARLM
jgi:hypothetical protein